MVIAEIILILCLPALLVYLTKKVKWLGALGAVTLCYACGFLLSLLPIPYDKGVAQTVASVLVALAIPLILFNFDLRDVKKLAKKTVVSFVLVIISVCSVAAIAAFAAASLGMKDAPAFSGMASGLYIGGTPNLFAIGDALLNDIDKINLANVSDSLVGGIYILLVFSVIKKIYKRLLGSADTYEAEHGEESVGLSGEYDYSRLPRDAHGIFRLVATVLIAGVCLGIGVLLELFINGNLDGSLYIMITVSVLGLAVSFIKPVREAEGSYQAGQYLILVFSLGLGMSIDWAKLVNDILPTLLFFFSVQMGSIIIHFILCKIFRIDGGTALITVIAGIYGPPFIAPTANSYGERQLIVPGMVCGTLGLAVGNLIGIGLGRLLAVFIK